MNSLQNHLLIAMPSLQDTLFERTVIYLCEHDEKGAMGLIINRPIGVKVNELLEQMQLEEGPSADSLSSHVLMGGPVKPERGFVIHTPQSDWNNSELLTQDLMMTTSKDILTAIGHGQSPENYMIILGYSGWSHAQLEQELAENSWLTIPATKELLFDIEYEDRWTKATESLGFNISQLSTQVGHS